MPDALLGVADDVGMLAMQIQDPVKFVLLSKVAIMAADAVDAAGVVVVVAVEVGKKADMVMTMIKDCRSPALETEDKG